MLYRNFPANSIWTEYYKLHSQASCNRLLKNSWYPCWSWTLDFCSLFFAYTSHGSNSFSHTWVFWLCAWLVKFVTYWFAICVAWNMLTWDDIQLSADVNFISAETILTLINEDWGIRLQILRKKGSYINQIWRVTDIS